ncbi:MULTISPECIES: LysR family transcriptional regulator [Tsukamurella]|uniref:LysR family transcriptional regulator n=2 Tax=Tsukamurella TaxID=2060 RepID=A0A5C5S280_9ACTN|nr:MULTISPECIES: LysR family transcriptional regulator [Tsukamurella]NMD56136.1 LysR family transcriptional regulator [Tsukamurella columbiensis]TWS28763.1 LysR family transcriptional regulator [Tsukamurella conjunctivitidis]
MADPILDIVPLRSVVAIARCGGVHRAAEALHLTQSTVSAHLRRLEKSTGGSIVEKAGRGVRFTDHGNRLLGHAQTILDAHDAAVHALSSPTTRTLSVSATEHGADRLIPELSRGFGSLPGGWTAQFRFDRSAQVAGAVEHGFADVAVFLAPIDHPDAVGPIALHWYAARDWEHPADAVPVLLFDDPCVLRAPAADALARHGIDYVVAAEAANLAGLYSAARSGLGVTLLPAIDATDGLVAVETMPVMPPIALAVTVGDRVPAPVRAAVRRAAAAVTTTA